MKLAAALTGMILGAIAVPALAATEPSASDDAAIDKLIAPAIAALEAGKARQAVDAYLGSNPLIASKTSDIAYLTSQIDSTMGIYGPISSCQLSQTRSNGPLVEQRLYHCQHKTFLTRWIFLSIKTQSGWIAGNLSFDDKVMNALGE